MTTRSKLRLTRPIAKVANRTLPAQTLTQRPTVPIPQARQRHQLRVVTPQARQRHQLRVVTPKARPPHLPTPLMLKAPPPH